MKKQKSKKRLLLPAASNPSSLLTITDQLAALSLRVTKMETTITGLEKRAQDYRDILRWMQRGGQRARERLRRETLFHPQAHGLQRMVDGK